MDELEIDVRMEDEEDEAEDDGWEDEALLNGSRIDLIGMEEHLYGSNI